MGRGDIRLGHHGVSAYRVPGMCLLQGGEGVLQLEVSVRRALQMMRLLVDVYGIVFVLVLFYV